MASSLPPIQLEITGDNSGAKRALSEVAAEAKTAAQAARQEADAAKAAAQEKTRAYEEAKRAARDASAEGKEAARREANALKDEADAARGAAKSLEENARAAEKVSAEKTRDVSRALKEQAQAADQARRANEENARAINAGAQRLNQIGRSVPGSGAMAAMMGGGQGMRSQMGDIRAAQRNLAMAGDGGPQAVDIGLLNKAGDSAQALTQNLGGVRNAAIGVTMVGVGGLRVSSELSQISMQAENAKASMESLLKQQGRGGDTAQVETVVADVAVKAHLANKDEARQQVVSMLSDEVKTADIPQLLESVVRNAQTLKKPMDEVGEAFSKAYTEGSLTRLKRCNILFSQQEEDSVKAAFGISKAAGQIEFMRVVTAATERDTNKLGESLSDIQKQTNDNTRAFNDFAVATGEGTQQADANVKGLAAGLARIISYNPSMAKGAGELLTYGSYATTAIGGLVGFGAQLGQLFVGWMALKAARLASAAADATGAGVKAADTTATVADTAATAANTGAKVADTAAEAVNTVATTANTVTTTANTVATTANAAAEGADAAATLENAAAKEALTVAEGAATVSAEAEAVAVGTAGAASAAAGVAATGAAVGFGLMAAGELLALWPLLAIGAAVVALVAALYKLSGAWDAENQAAADSKQADAADKKFYDQQQARLAQGKKADTTQGETFEQWQKRKGRGDENDDDPSASTPSSASGGAVPDFDKMKADAQAQQSAALVAPTSSAPVAVPATASASVASDSSGETQTAPTGNGANRLRALQDERDPNADQITALMREKRDLKGKSNAGKRDDLQRQIDAMHDASRAWKERHHAEMEGARDEQRRDKADEREAKKQQRDAEREEKKAEREKKKAEHEATKERQDNEKNQLIVSKAKIVNDSEDKIADLEDALDVAKKNRDNAKIYSLTLQIEEAKADQRYAESEAAAEEEEDPKRAAAEIQAAKLNRQHDERKGKRAADQAAHSMEKSGKDDAKQHDARIRAELSMMGTGVGFSRFDALPVVTAPPVRADLQAPFASAPRIAIPSAPLNYRMDTGGMMGSTRGAAGDVRVGVGIGARMDASGKLILELGNAEIALRDLGLGIGSQRGRVRR